MARMNKCLALALLMAVAGPVLAGEACYSADQQSGELRFSGLAEGAPFRGQFREFAVRLCLDGEDLSTAAIAVTVKTGSADVGNRDGNQALKDTEFFAVEQFPQATWRSSGIARGDNGYVAEGELAIKSIVAPQAVNLALDTGSEPWVLSGSAEIMRLDWEVGVGEFEDTDFIRDRVDLRFELKLQEESDA